MENKLTAEIDTWKYYLTKYVDIAQVVILRLRDWMFLER
jgi:hypothetical protein